MEVKPIEKPAPVKRMEPSLFEKIRDDITDICRRIGASGSNGRTHALELAMAGYFNTEGIPQADYWNEVSIRSGAPYLTAASVDQLTKRTVKRKKFLGLIPYGK